MQVTMKVNIKSVSSPAPSWHQTHQTQQLRSTGKHMLLHQKSQHQTMCTQAEPSETKRNPDDSRIAGVFPPQACVCYANSVCVSTPGQRVLNQPRQGAIPLPSGGWPTKRPLGGAANVPAELLYKLSLHSFFVCFHGGSGYFP